MFAAAAAITLGPGGARADDNTVTVGMILPMTGRRPRQASRSAPAPRFIFSSMATRSPARRSWSKSRTTPARPDVTKRLAEELIGNDHAKVLIGLG